MFLICYVKQYPFMHKFINKCTFVLKFWSLHSCPNNLFHFKQYHIKYLMYSFISYEVPQIYICITYSTLVWVLIWYVKKNPLMHKFVNPCQPLPLHSLIFGYLSLFHYFLNDITCGTSVFNMYHK
jgi:hypothetical protein